MQRKKHAAASPISASNYDNNAKRKTPNRATLTRKCILLVFIASLLVVSSNIYIRFLSITVSDHTAEPIKRVPYKETIARRKQYDDQWWRGMSKDYPHWRGARHPNGTEGMLVDPSPNRLATLDRTKIQCSPTKGAGIEGEGGYKVLQKVKAENPNIVKTGPRILCLVYTVDLPPNGVNDDVANHANLRSIATTWGSKCDGFIGASNSTNHSIGAIDLLHKGEESYNNMWQKVRAMWAYATNYIAEFDYFHIIGDDAYVYVDNLRRYLNSQEHAVCIITCCLSRPLFFGAPLFKEKDDGLKEIYPAGGSGYTLNRAALQLLQTHLGTYFPDDIDPREDAYMGGLFSSLGVYVSNTLDGSRGARYIGSAEQSYRFQYGVTVSEYPMSFMFKFNIRRYFSLDGVSSTAVSFHLKYDAKWLAKNNHTIADLMIRYHSILYGKCAD
ncbi:hypothetical protein ACHAWO_008743 [Cyclotella atomus]|uniref:Hexosyltransferase n=1 Tax=Cyclotella atomus TaxID=382360 RepID=A0ABD3NNS2_9STRA